MSSAGSGTSASGRSGPCISVQFHAQMLKEFLFSIVGYRMSRAERSGRVRSAAAGLDCQ